jgi:hypothetical protein
MKYKLYYILLLMIFICGCEMKPFTSVKMKSETIILDKEYYAISYDLNEFQYKDHTYLSLHTKNAMGGFTHAGHCLCNK